MFVCYCNMVSEDEVKQVLQDNPSITTVHELRERILVANCCGGCVNDLLNLINEHIAQRGELQ